MSSELGVSRFTAVVLLIVYAGYLIFQAEIIILFTTLFIYIIYILLLLVLLIVYAGYLIFQARRANRDYHHYEVYFFIYNNNALVGGGGFLVF